MAERRFAGTVIKVNDKVLAKVTSFSRSKDFNEADVTGAEDLTEGGQILQQKFISVSVGETVTLEGIAISEDEGQSELADVADRGVEAVLEQTGPDGYGYKMTGYFTSYEESGSISEGVYTFSATFRVNEKEALEPEP